MLIRFSAGVPAFLGSPHMAAALTLNRFHCTSLNLMDSSEDVGEIPLIFLLCCTLGLNQNKLNP